jgi:hypothetical protein
MRAVPRPPESGHKRRHAEDRELPESRRQHSGRALVGRLGQDRGPEQARDGGGARRTAPERREPSPHQPVQQPANDPRLLRRHRRHTRVAHVILVVSPCVVRSSQTGDETARRPVTRRASPQILRSSAAEGPALAVTWSSVLSTPTSVLRADRTARRDPRRCRPSRLRAGDDRDAHPRAPAPRVGKGRLGGLKWATRGLGWGDSGAGNGRLAAGIRALVRLVGVPVSRG